MFSGLHFFWMLLPLSFLLLFFWALSKKRFGVAGKENAWGYFSQFVFTAIALVVAIYVEQRVLESLYESLPLDFIDIAIPRFLTYPAVLLAGAYLQKLLSKKETDMRHGRTKAYQR